MHDASFGKTGGVIDFEDAMQEVHPDIFCVTEAGDAPAKRAICAAKGVRYVVIDMKGIEEVGSPGPVRRAQIKLSIHERFGRLEKLTEEDHQLHGFPWRICLAGGWLDQPWVSEICPGSCIVVNVHPHQQFKTRSGLATSTRTYGMKLWGTLAGGRPPIGEETEDLALMLFGAENPPGCKYVAGSQDALGLMLPGVNRLDYNGEYW